MDACGMTSVLVSRPRMMTTMRPFNDAHFISFDCGMRERPVVLPHDQTIVETVNADR